MKTVINFGGFYESYHSMNIDSIIERETNLYLRSVVNSVDVKNTDLKLISARGSVLDTIDAIDDELGIDLIIVGPKSNSIKDEVFLGRTSGSIVKRTEIPVLIIPNDYKFQPIKSILTAFNSGIINKKKTLKPLEDFVAAFSSDVNLLLVKTPDYTEEDLVLDAELKKTKNNLTVTENATTFLGVLEHFQSHNPDLLCVFRRKRGFFQKFWEKNSIQKKEFNCNVPVLVLRGKL